MIFEEFSESCFLCLINKESNVPPCFIRIDVAHMIHMICMWKCLQGRKQIKDFYVRSIGLLIKSESLEYYDCILRNILILATAESYGTNTFENETPAERARIFLEDLISGIDNIKIHVDDSKEIQILTDFHCNPEKEPQDNTHNSELKKWINNINDNVILEAAVEGNKLNPNYCKDLVKPLISICKEFPLWSAVMVKIFRSPNIVGSSARIEGYFAELKSTIIDKSKPRMRVDKFIVTHLRAIRRSMKLTGSFIKHNNYEINTKVDTNKKKQKCN